MLNNHRQHLDKDLQPYVCMSEQCKEPVRFFAHSGHWIEHMRGMHKANWTQEIHSTVWVCDILHSEKHFDEKEDFENHLKNDHDPPPTDAQCFALVRRKKKSAIREPSFCPLCERPVGASSPASPPDSGLSPLESHIADHLKYLAFFSLPSLDDSHREEGAPNSEIHASVDLESENKPKQYLDSHSDDNSELTDTNLSFDRDPEIEGEEAAGGHDAENGASGTWEFVGESDKSSDDPILEHFRTVQVVDMPNLPLEHQSRVSPPTPPAAEDYEDSSVEQVEVPYIVEFTRQRW